ncbi:MAG: EAL domain-containing protein [Methylococcaceae bacterium]
MNKKGHYEGIAADYIKLLEQRLSVKFEIIKGKKTWHDILGMAKRGEVDMLSCLVKTPDRQEFLNFGEPYLKSSAVIITENSNGYIASLENLAGKLVTIQKGHFTEEILRKNHPEIGLVLTDSIEKSLEMVSNGQVFAYVGDVTAASYVMKKKGFLNLVFSGSTPYQSQFSFATHKSKPILASIMKKALQSIEQEERDAIFNHWRAIKITEGINLNVFFRYVLGVVCLFVLFAYWIYKLRQSTSALKASEAKLQLILDTEPECVKVLNANGCLVQINPAGLKMIEAEDSAALLIGEKANGLVVAKDQQAFNNMTQRVLKGESCILQYQIKGLKGTKRWVESHAVPLVDELNHSVSVLSVTRDISEHKQTEEAQKIATMVYQNSSEAMLVTNSDDLIIAINPAFSKITGYSFEEVRNKNPSVLKPGLQDDQFYKEMWHSLDSTGHWEGEIWNKHKDGNEYAEWLVINTIYSEDGTVAQRVSLFSDITEKKRSEKLIWKQANYDSLTGLPNRNMFLDRLNQDIKLASRSEKSLAVIFLDLDFFKEVNDTLGHAKGDELLCETAKRLLACVRETDTVARLGGDEFIIVLPELDRFFNLDRVAEKIIQSLSQVFKLAEEQAFVSASLGIAMYPNDAIESEGLIKHADQAMYLSKEKGRAQFSYFTKAMQEQAQYRLHLVKDMRGALQANQFELYYQPIVDLKTGDIIKAEALIRWNHPTRGLVSPADFIPLAENSGLIVEIGDWVFKQAARQVKYWRDHFDCNLQVSVNKSPVQFQVANNRDDWLDYLKQINLSGGGIVIEITEGLLMDSAPNIIHQLLQYRDAGIQVSMDDFGTGYSALSYLKKFDIDYLKIDRSFTRNLVPGSNDMALSEAIILMSHKLGLKVIAEGIETEQQRDLLTAAGCNYGQGFLFSKPVPADEFETLLDKRKISLS